MQSIFVGIVTRIDVLIDFVMRGFAISMYGPCAILRVFVISVYLLIGVI